MAACQQAVRKFYEIEFVITTRLLLIVFTNVYRKYAGLADIIGGRIEVGGRCKDVDLWLLVSTGGDNGGRWGLGGRGKKG